MDFAAGLHAACATLGRAGGGGYLPFAALTAIHMAHRLGALRAAGRARAVAWRLHGARRGAAPLRRSALLGAGAWQLASGLGNVLLGWPLLAARGAHRRARRRWSSLLTRAAVRSAPARAAARRSTPAARRRRLHRIDLA